MSSKQAFRKVFLLAVVSWIVTVEGSAATVDPPLDPLEGAVLWRWIGVLQPGAASCPTPSSLGTGWNVRPLFEVGSHLRCPELERFCVWEYDGSAGAVAADDARCLDEMDGTYEVTPLGSQKETMQCLETTLADADPDVMALVPAGVLSAEQAPLLEATFLSQTGRIALPTYPSTAPEVWWTLLDTSPTGSNGSVPESSPHGATLRLLARKLLCDPQNGAPPGDCVAEIRTRLALAYTAFDPVDPTQSTRDEVHGGRTGLVGELAEVLAHELDDWAGSAADRLVVNLSVAWDRLYGGASAEDEMPPNVLAVYRALECSSCQGAVVVAAAGNVSDLHAANDFDQAMMPAAWTSLPSSACLDSPPLLYAAGALDAARRPLSNALALGMPEFGAYSDHPVLTSGLTTPTPPLTGSSTAALVVSATAAAVTYYDPGMSVDDVMATIHGAGDITPRLANLCRHPLNACPKVSYVSLCESVHSVCQGGCPVTLPPCPARPSAPPDFSTSGVMWPVTTTSDVAAFPLYAFSGQVLVCGDDVPLASPVPPIDPCPRRQHHGVARRPGVHPQPEVGLCPSCLYDTSTGVFYAELEVAQNVDVESPTLHLTCGGWPYNYGVPLPLNNNGVATLTNLPTGCTTAMFSSDLYESAVLQGSTTEPVLIGIAP